MKYKVRLSSNSPHLRRIRPKDVMLGDEIFDWLQTQVGARDRGAWYFDNTDDAEVMLFEFKTRNHAIMFKLVWGGM